MCNFKRSIARSNFLHLPQVDHLTVALIERSFSFPVTDAVYLLCANFDDDDHREH